MSIFRGSAAFLVLSARNGVLARARNRANKRVVSEERHGRKFPFDLKTHRTTQGLGWCIDTRVCIPAFVLWTRR